MVVCLISHHKRTVHLKADRDRLFRQSRFGCLVHTRVRSTAFAPAQTNRTNQTNGPIGVRFNRTEQVRRECTLSFRWLYNNEYYISFLPIDPLNPTHWSFNTISAALLVLEFLKCTPVFPINSDVATCPHVSFSLLKRTNMSFSYGISYHLSFAIARNKQAHFWTESVPPQQTQTWTSSYVNYTDYDY